MGKFKTAQKMLNMSNRRTLFPGILLPILVVALLLSACGQSASRITAPSGPITGAPAQAPDTPAAAGGLDGATLLAQHCSACHSSNLAGMTCTANQWKELVDQMINQGAQLTPQEKQVLIAYLAATYHP
jgi:cytochrome c5